MSTRAKLIGSVAFALVALVAWRFYSPTTELPLVDTLPPAAELATGPVALVAPKPVAPVPARTVHNELMQRTPAASQPAPPVPDANALNERTLVGTRWQRGGFGLEFGADGKLLIGGRERARWRVEGPRIRLYRDATGEEHWLEIVGNKLMWEGQEIGRAP